MANAKISDNSVFVPKTNITDVVGLAGYDDSGNVKISGTQLKASVLSGAIQTIAATSPLQRTTGSNTTISILEASTTQDGYLSSINFTAFSDADGTVKSVGGTGSVSGITLSGTVTDSGNLTLGGALTLTSANVTEALAFTPYSAANPSNFTSNLGTVTNIIFSAPLTGGTISSSGTVGITAAGTNSDGYLTKGDWNTFNSKTDSSGTVKSVGGTGTVNGISLSGSVTGSGDLTLGGALDVDSASIISFLGYTPYNATNPLGFTSNTGTVTQVTTTAPLSGSVASTGSLSITKADTNTDGYLTSTDWTTFNNKTSFAEPGIFSGGGTPTLAANVTGAEIRTLIGAGTGNGDVTAESITDFTNKSGNISQWTNDENYTNNVGTVTADNSIAFTNKSGNISQWTNDSNYITSAGDNTFVTTAALSGGTLTLTRNDSVTVDASGFLQIGATSSDALAGDTTTITGAQATAINDNSLKTSFPGFGAVSGKALEGDTVIPTVNDGKLSISVDGTVTDFTANQSGDATVTIVTGDSDNFYVTGASYATGTLTLTRNGSLANVTADGFLQVGTNSSDALAGNTVTITGAQAAEISDNTLKVGYTDALVEANTAVAANTAKKSNVQSDWSSTTGLSEILNKPTIPGEAPVDSVNTQVGAVVLTTGDINEGSNLYYTEARVNSNSNVAANTLKQTFPGFGVTSTTALKGDTTTITAIQAAAITDNSSKTSFPGFGLTSTTALKGDTVIPPAAPVDSVNGQTGAVTLTTITAAQTNEIAANTLKTSMVLGTASNEALAGDTALLQIGTTSTTALAGDTFIPKIKGYTGSLQFMDCRGECLEMVIDNGLITEVNRA